MEPLEESKKAAFNRELVKDIKHINGEVGYTKMCEIIRDTVPKHFELKTFTRKRKEWSQGTENTFEKQQQSKKRREMGRSARA